MINIIKRDNKITISGHANFKKTNDIVCASVSSIMYTTINALLKFDIKSIDFIDDGIVSTIIINKNDKITKTLIDNMISAFIEIEESYPKNVKFKED